MSERLATTLAALLLAGCQATLPNGLAVPDSALKLQARTSADQASELKPLPAEHLAALASLDEHGYNIGWQTAYLPNATFTLDSVPYEGGEKPLEGVVFADYLAALAEAQRNGTSNVVPSLNLIDGVCKQINDGVYARLEVLWEQQHAAPLRAKLLAALQAAWQEHQDDPAWQNLLTRMLASIKLAGGTPVAPDALQAKVNQTLSDFEATPEMAKPLGFYAITDELQRIYRADRMLQRLTYFNGPDGSMSPQNVHEAALAASIATDPAIAKALDDTGSFYQKMANPFRAFAPTQLQALQPAGTDWLALPPATLYQAATTAKKPGMLLAYGWVPPSGSAEDALFDQAPEGESDLMGYLIREIKAGHVSLAPKPDSGFYQYQEYALEALLTPDKQPEGKKIHFGDAYLKRLEEAFKTGLAKARETQVKQTCWFCSEPTSVPPPPAKPRMFVEPIGTVYKRYGDMYDFLERQVLPLFPADALDAARPIEETGDGPRSVRAQVAFGKQLMYGLYLVSADQLGLKPETVPVDPVAALKAAKDWLATYQQDPYIARDTRVAVPIRQSQEDDPLVTYWGTAGVTLLKLQFAFETIPDGFSSLNKEPVSYFVAADKFVTFKRRRSKGLLDRAAYRQILDGAKTMGEALQRLQG